VTKTIVHVVGARPNFMKIAPIMRGLEKFDCKQILVHTGQHYDHEMSDAFLADLRMPQPDYRLEVGSASHSQQTARILDRLSPILDTEVPQAVVVAGDVTSTLAAALTATFAKITTVHVEAGLRSFDWSMPEEHNRRVVDHLSQLCLTHSESANENLLREGIDPDYIRLVGNTMIDSLFAHLADARRSAPHAKLGLADRGYVLVTLHRPRLVDDPELLQAIVHSLDELATRIPVVFPVHPRTRVRLDALGIEMTRVRLLDPLDYLAFIGLEAAALAVLTDSGGIQEETTALGVPCFTLRDNTERPVTCTHGTNQLLGTDPARVVGMLDRLPTAAGEPVPLWDGHAGERSAAAIAALAGLATLQPDASRR
jgi:UDP-N-acetylglucosamine 2-epimerase (non-hydrolysing)